MLIRCDECGNQVSDKAKACPNCGMPQAGIQNRNDSIKRFKIEKAYVVLVLYSIISIASLSFLLFEIWGSNDLLESNVKINAEIIASKGGVEIKNLDNFPWRNVSVWIDTGNTDNRYIHEIDYLFRDERIIPFSEFKHFLHDSSIYDPSDKKIRSIYIFCDIGEEEGYFCKDFGEDGE